MAVRAFGVSQGVLGVGSLLGVAVVCSLGCTNQATGEASPTKRYLGIIAGTPNQTNHAAAYGIVQLIEERINLKRFGFDGVGVVATKGAVANVALISDEEDQKTLEASLESLSPAATNSDGDHKENTSVDRDESVACDYREWIEQSYFDAGGSKVLGSQKNGKVRIENRRFIPYIGFVDALSISQLEKNGNLRVVVPLWKSHVHVLVSEDVAKLLRAKGGNLSLERLAKLRIDARDGELGKLKVYVGSDASSTNLAGRALFAAVGLGNEEFLPHGDNESAGPGGQNVVRRRQPRTHLEAAKALVKDPGLIPLDAAVLVAGLPSDAVKLALKGKCEILEIDRDGILNWAESNKKSKEAKTIVSLDWDESVPRSVGKPVPPVMIPADAYDGRPIATCTTQAWLVAHRDLNEEFARQLVEELFTARLGRTGQEIVLRHHAAAEEISLVNGLNSWKARGTRSLEYHAGAEEFWVQEESGDGDVVQIYAGPMGGTSYRLGAELAEILTSSDLPIVARVVSTRGSSDSIAQMQAENRQGRGLALVHNDAAADAFSKTEKTSRGDEALRLLSFLYRETVHLVAVDRVPATDANGEELCCCPQITGLSDQATLREVVTALADKMHRFGVSDDEFSRKRDEMIIQYYWDLGRAATTTGDLSISDVKSLSPVELQERLMEGSLHAALVTSGTPMPLINQMLTPDHPRLARRQKLIEESGKDAPICAGCKRPQSSRNLSFRVLPLDAGGIDAQGKPFAPKSLRGLATRNPMFKPTVIPPNTYMNSQPEETHTVGVELVLLCNKSLQLNPASILNTLFENEVRLRNIVAETDLRDPLGANSKDPSIPLHAKARKFYESKGLLLQIPEPEKWWSSERMWTIVLSFSSLLIGAVAPDNWRHKIQRVLFGWVFRREKRRNRFEREITGIYFDDELEPKTKSDRIEEVMREICRACRRGELSHSQAESLDLLARAYLDRLHDAFSWSERVASGASGLENGKGAG